MPIRLCLLPDLETPGSVQICESEDHLQALELQFDPLGHRKRTWCIMWNSGHVLYEHSMDGGLFFTTLSKPFHGFIGGHVFVLPSLIVHALGRRCPVKSFPASQRLPAAAWVSNKYIYIYINKIIRVKNKSVAGSLNMYTVIVIYSRNRKEGGRRQAFFDPALKRVLC